MDISSEDSKHIEKIVDSYSKEITKAVEDGDSVYESFFFWDQHAEKPVDVVYVNVYIQRDPDYIFPYDVVGGADHEEIEMTITINDSIYEDYTDDLMYEIEDTLRHEMEHLSQHRDDDKPTPKVGDFVSYFHDAMQAHEIPAYVKGFRRKAKSMGVSFKEVVEQYLIDHSDKFNDSEKATLKRTWLDYHGKHFKGSRKESLNESVGNKKDDIKDFILMCKEELGLRNLPKIIITHNREDLRTTAHYMPNQEVKVYGKNRALVDVLRSIAHELVHHKQYENDELKGNIPDIGGPIEDEANAYAGRFIKMYAKKGNSHIYQN